MGQVLERLRPSESSGGRERRTIDGDSVRHVVAWHRVGVVKVLVFLDFASRAWHVFGRCSAEEAKCILREEESSATGSLRRKFECFSGTAPFLERCMSTASQFLLCRQYMTAEQEVAQLKPVTSHGVSHGVADDDEHYFSHQHVLAFGKIEGYLGGFRYSWMPPVAQLSYVLACCSHQRSQELNHTVTVQQFRSRSGMEQEWRCLLERLRRNNRRQGALEEGGGHNEDVVEALCLVECRDQQCFGAVVRRLPEIGWKTEKCVDAAMSKALLLLQQTRFATELVEMMQNPSVLRFRDHPRSEVPLSSFVSSRSRNTAEEGGLGGNVSLPIKSRSQLWDCGIVHWTIWESSFGGHFDRIGPVTLIETAMEVAQEQFDEDQVGVAVVRDDREDFEGPRLVFANLDDAEVVEEAFEQGMLSEENTRMKKNDDRNGNVREYVGSSPAMSWVLRKAGLNKQLILVSKKHLLRVRLDKASSPEDGDIWEMICQRPYGTILRQLGHALGLRLIQERSDREGHLSDATRFPIRGRPMGPFPQSPTVMWSDPPASYFDQKYAPGDLLCLKFLYGTPPLCTLDLFGDSDFPHVLRRCRDCSTHSIDCLCCYSCQRTRHDGHRFDDERTYLQACDSPAFEAESLFDCQPLKKSLDWDGQQAEWTKYPNTMASDVVAVSDTHLGMNEEEYCHREALTRLILKCQQDANVGMLIFVGDAFDSWAHSHDQPMTLSRILESLKWFRQTILDVAAADPPLKCVFVRGNHDDDLTATLLRQYFILDPSLRASQSKRIRAGENVIFGGDVFVLPVCDGLLVFTHGHIGDAWNCRYWTGPCEPYGRFLCGLAASKSDFTGPTENRTTILRDLLSIAKPFLGWDLLETIGRKVVTKEAYRAKNRRSLRETKFHGSRTTEVEEQLEFPLFISVDLGLERFGCLPRLNDSSEFRWILNEATFRKNLTLPSLGVIPDSLLEMFLPGAVGIITGHVHGKAFVKEKVYKKSFVYVHGNTGDWHPRRDIEMGGIYISQVDNCDDDTPWYLTFTWERNSFVFDNYRAVNLPPGEGRRLWFHGDDGQHKYYVTESFRETSKRSARHMFEKTCSVLSREFEEEEGEFEDARPHKCPGHRRDQVTRHFPAHCDFVCGVGHDEE